jgi:hypothetical protein
MRDVDGRASPLIFTVVKKGVSKLNSSGPLSLLTAGQCPLVAVKPLVNAGNTHSNCAWHCHMDTVHRLDLANCGTTAAVDVACALQ